MKQWSFQSIKRVAITNLARKSLENEFNDIYSQDRPLHNLFRSLANYLGILRWLEAEVLADARPSDAYRRMHLYARYQLAFSRVYLTYVRHKHDEYCQAVRKGRLRIIPIDSVFELLFAAGFGVVLGLDEVADSIVDELETLLREPTGYVQSQGWSDSLYAPFLFELLMRRKGRTINLPENIMRVESPFAEILAGWNDESKLAASINRYLDEHCRRCAKTILREEIGFLG